MNRRVFITLLGGTAAAWPMPARAQQQGAKPLTIGFLGAATSASWNQWTAAFVQRLREFGWIEGRNVLIEYRWAEGRSERAAEIAAEFVRLKVDVIVAWGSPGHPAKQATSWRGPGRRAGARTASLGRVRAADGVVCPEARFLNASNSAKITAQTQR
jgi:putative tryptophan/tyrosine transport system substrate-binding protein